MGFHKNIHLTQVLKPFTLHMYVYCFLFRLMFLFLTPKQNNYTDPVDTEQFTDLLHSALELWDAATHCSWRQSAAGGGRSLPRHCRHCNSIFQKNLPYSKLSTRLTSNIRFLLRQTSFLDFKMVQNGLLLLTPNCEK